MPSSTSHSAAQGGSTYQNRHTDKLPSEDSEHHPEATHGEQNQWKFRAPYRVHENDPNFKTRYNGSCHCGKVTFKLSREKPLDAKYCHCRTCQKLHAAPFQWCAVFHKDDINFTNGVHDLGWYESGEKTCVHKLPCKVSCAYCRTPIMDEGRNMILLFPELIDWEDEKDKENFKATCHMFYPRRVLDINDGLPKWSGIQGQSELIADTPEDTKRKREEEVSKEEEENRKKEKKEKGGEAHSE